MDIDAYIRNRITKDIREAEAAVAQAKANLHAAVDRLAERGDWHGGLDVQVIEQNSPLAAWFRRIDLASPDLAAEVRRVEDLVREHDLANETPSRELRFVAAKLNGIAEFAAKMSVRGFQDV